MKPNSLLVRRYCRIPYLDTDRCKTPHLCCRFCREEKREKCRIRCGAFPLGLPCRNLINFWERTLGDGE